MRTKHGVNWTHQLTQVRLSSHKYKTSFARGKMKHLDLLQDGEKGVEALTRAKMRHGGLGTRAHRFCFGDGLKRLRKLHVMGRVSLGNSTPCLRTRNHKDIQEA